MTGPEDKEIELVGFPSPFGPFPERAAGRRVGGQHVVGVWCQTWALPFSPEKMDKTCRPLLFVRGSD